MENAIYELKQEEMRTQIRNIERKMAATTVETTTTPTPTPTPTLT
jgi:hypothetical protein